MINCCRIVLATHLTLHVRTRFLRLYVCRSSGPRRHISRFHDGLILFQFDTIAPNLVPSVSNYLLQLSVWEQMKKVPNS